MLCIHTDKRNFHNNFQRTVCTSCTKWLVVKLHLEGVRLSKVTQCNLFLFTKLVRSQVPYASMYILCWQHFILFNKLQEVLIFYLYIQRYPPVFGLSFQNKKKLTGRERGSLERKEEHLKIFQLEFKINSQSTEFGFIVVQNRY